MVQVKVTAGPPDSGPGAVVQVEGIKVVCAEVQDMADGALSPIAAAQLAAAADHLVALLTTRITEVRVVAGSTLPYYVASGENSVSATRCFVAAYQ